MHTSYARGMFRKPVPGPVISTDVPPFRRLITYPTTISPATSMPHVSGSGTLETTIVPPKLPPAVPTTLPPIFKEYWLFSVKFPAFNIHKSNVPLCCGAPLATRVRSFPVFLYKSKEENDRSLLPNLIEPKNDAKLVWSCILKVN